MRRFPSTVVETGLGGLAEWSKAAVLKTVEPRGSRGSNPWPTAIQMKAPLGARSRCSQTVRFAPSWCPLVQHNPHQQQGDKEEPTGRYVDLGCEIIHAT